MSRILNLNKKKFLIVSTEFPPYDGKASKIGGMGTWMYELAKNMVEIGIDVSVLGLNKTDRDFEFDARQIFYISRMRKRGWRNFKDFVIAFYFLRIFFLRRPDYVLLAAIDLATMPVLLSKIFRFKVALFVCGLDIMQKMSTWERAKKQRLLNNVDKIIVCSEFVKEAVLGYGVNKDKVVVCLPGVDVEKFSVPDNSALIRERLELTDKIVLATVGRLIERKGQDMVIKSLPTVLKEVPNIVYLIVGTGNFKSQLECISKDIGVADKVIFTGFVTDEDIISYFRVADIFIMPSRVIEDKGDVEGFGINLIEANMCKKPVIAGKSGGVVDAVEDGINGLLVNPTDLNEISDAIIKLALDSELRRRIGEQGYTRALDRFDYKKKVPILMEALMEEA